MKDSEAKNLSGCCGLYCGLCSKYQSKAPSRCIGCRLGEQHSWCSIWNCCTRKHAFSTCAECNEVFKCAIFIRRKVIQWIPAADNLGRIKEEGLGSWIKEQKRRQALLEESLRNYSEGRSMNLYCKACARMPIDLIDKALREAEGKAKAERMPASDLKSKAMILRSTVKDLAFKAGVTLD